MDRSVHDAYTNTGYQGSTVYSLKYILHTRNYRIEWPHNNIMNKADNEQGLLSSLLKQHVGTTRFEIAQGMDTLNSLSAILKVLLYRHKKIDYKKILKIVSSHCGTVKAFSVNRKFDSTTEQTNDVKFIRTKCCLGRRIVRRLLRYVVYNVLPFELFGINRNRIRFLKAVLRICSLGKRQVFALKYLLDGISVKRIPFLKSTDDNLRRTNLLAKTYVWLVRCYIFGTLKCCFYITESVRSNRLLFFTKSVWQSIADYHFFKLRRKKFQSIELNSQFGLNDVECKRPKSVLRIIPKQSGLRAVVTHKNYKKYRTQDAKFVAKFLQKLSEHYPRGRLSSCDNFYVKWLEFYRKWSIFGKPFVYFVRVDFYDTFGSVNQNKMMEIIKRVSENVYGKNGTVTLAVNSICYTNRPNALHSCVEYYIKNYIFKNNKYTYKIIEGIPQGGRYSAALCNIYLNDLDCKYLEEFSNDSDGLLLRLCDDYFYVSFHLEKTIRFLHRMESGFPDYGLGVNMNKTRTNVFDSNTNMVCFNLYDIDLRTLQIYGCYDCYERSSLFHRMIFNHVKMPGRLLKSRMAITRSLKLRKEYFNLEYNTDETVIRNVHHLTVLLALKYCAIVKNLFGHYNKKFLLRCILSLADKIAVLIREKFISADLISEHVTKWTVLNGFIITLQYRKQYIQSNLLCVKYLWSKKFEQQIFIQNKRQLNFLQGEEFKKLPEVFKTIY